jgi:hypothetical protein
LGLESGELIHQFIFVGPAHQVKFHQFQNRFVRLETRPDRDQQARDDRDVELKLQTVLVVADEMPAAEDVLEETKGNSGQSPIYLLTKWVFGGILRICHE